MIALLSAALPTLATPRLATVPRLVNIAVAQQSNVVRIPAFLSDDEIQSIHDAADTVGKNVETHDLHRRQGAPEGSWFTVFLNHRLQELLPDIHTRMMDAARAADAGSWQVLDEERFELNLRCAEYHSVLPGGGIPMAKHHDYGSLLTLDIMLSDSETDFEGGNFETLEADGSRASHEFKRGDLLIFLSHKYHCVRPVTAGRRRVLVCELWEGLPRRCVKRCNEPWGACVCEFGPAPTLYQPAAQQAKQQFSKLRPCLRLFSKSTEELDALSASLAVEPSDASEYEQLGAHRQFVARKEIDRQRTQALSEAKEAVTAL